jgi:hypothetical protein
VVYLLFSWNALRIIFFFSYLSFSLIVFYWYGLTSFFHSLHYWFLSSFLFLYFLISKFYLFANTITCTCTKHESLNSIAFLYGLNISHASGIVKQLKPLLSDWNCSCGSASVRTVQMRTPFSFTSCRIRSLKLRLLFHNAWPHPAHIHYTFAAIQAGFISLRLWYFSHLRLTLSVDVGVSPWSASVPSASDINPINIVHTE